MTMKFSLTAFYLPLIWFLAGCSYLKAYPAISTSTASDLTSFPSPFPTNLPIPTTEPSTVLTPTTTKRSTITPSPTILFTQLSELKQGQYLIFSTFNFDNEKSLIGVLSVDGVFSGFLTESLSDSVSISPNQKFLAFVYPNTLKDPNILDLENMELTPIKFRGMYCVSPSWSPDSGQLALYCGSSEPYKSEDIYIFTVQSGLLNQLSLCTSDMPVCIDPIWSPDGKWIAYYQSLGGAGTSNSIGLHLIDTACLDKPSSCKGLEKGPFDIQEPFAWSPESKQLAGYWDHSIRILELNKQSMVIIRDIEVTTSIDSIAWSPDGNMIVYTNSNQIYTLSLQGGKPTLLYEATHVRVKAWIAIP